VISGALDVLLVSSTELPEIDDLREDGLAVDRVESLVAAVGRLRASRAGLVVAGGELCAGREGKAFGAFREAGASAVLAVYPPHLGWRAPRAIAAGADDSVVLPLHPGALQSRALRLLHGGPAADLAMAPPPLVSVRRRGGDDSLESLVGDVAAIHRNVSDLERMLELVVQTFASRGRAARCSLMLLDESRSELYVRKSLGLPEGAPWAPVPVGKGFAGRVAKSGLPLLVADTEAMRGENGFECRPGAYRTRSCLVLPLRASRGILGVICLSDKETGEPFDDADLAALAFLADQGAQAIENALQYRQMKDLAAIDELTGLSNRRQFQFSLDREIQRARRYDRPLTLAMFDVDHFKKYNDACGHPAGDRALATIGEILRNALREVDLVARYGGEEFAVILPETHARPGGVSPFPFLERLRRRVETAVFPGEDKLPSGKLTLSGGIACFPDDAESGEDLVREADRALYVSKARGRNSITYRGATVTD
jgi:diguanylate cyclase (GGDEF)-like protein